MFQFFGFRYTKRVKIFRMMVQNFVPSYYCCCCRVHGMKGRVSGAVYLGFGYAICTPARQYAVFFTLPSTQDVDCRILQRSLSFLCKMHQVSRITWEYRGLKEISSGTVATLPKARRATILHATLQHRVGKSDIL